MKSSAARTFAFLLLGALTSFAQTGGSGTGSGTGAGSGSGTGTGTSTTTTAPVPRTTPRPRSQPNTMESRPIMLSGEVKYDDGSAVNERVAIERVCNGQARREGYTDSKGSFTIMIGGRSPITEMQDASVGSDGLSNNGFGTFSRPASGNASNMDLGGGDSMLGCELRASASGARSDSIQLTGRRALDDPHVGIIFLHRMGKVDGRMVSVTAMQAPGDAKKAYKRALKAAKKGKTAEEQKYLEDAVKIYPQYAEAWGELANTYMAQNRFDDARAACEKAIAADSKFLPPYFPLIVLTASSNDWKHLAEVTDTVLALDSYSYAAAFYYNAFAYLHLGNLQKADASIRSAKRLDTQVRLPKIALLVGVIAMERRDFDGAVQAFRDFLTRVPTGAEADYARTQLTAIQKTVASSPQGAAAEPQDPKNPK